MKRTNERKLPIRRKQENILGNDKGIKEIQATVYDDDKSIFFEDGKVTLDTNKRKVKIEQEWRRKEVK